jgi:hypothetical protein
VVEKQDFCAIQQKILLISDFTKKWDANPLPHGDVVDNIAKMFANIFCKNWILRQKTRFLRKSDRIFVKFPGPFSFFPIFTIFLLPYDFRKKIGVFAKIGVFHEKHLAKISIFAKISVFRENRRFS